MPPAFIFVIDVSSISSQTGFLTAVLETLKDIFINNYFLNVDRTKVGIITYDSTVHFYRLIENSSQPQMFCVSDNEMFLPVPVN